MLGRGLAVTVLAALTLWLLAWLLDGFTIDRPQDALLAGLVVGLVNAVVWPALAVVVVPLSVLTLGIGADRARRAVRLRSCSICFPASSSPASGRPWPSSSGSPR